MNLRERINRRFSTRRPEAATGGVQAAADRYNADHARDWGPPGRGTCPICGHRDCFGRAGGRLANSGDWACFSANHGNVGRKVRTERGNAACMAGDALDVDAHAAGRTRVEHLRATGYLPRLQPDTRHQKSPSKRILLSAGNLSAPKSQPQHPTPKAASGAASAVGCRADETPPLILSEYEAEWLEERAAILEFEGGMTRQDAEREAARLLALDELRERV